MTAVMEPPKKHAAGDDIFRCQPWKSQEPSRAGVSPGGAGCRGIPAARLERHPEYLESKMLERITEPESVLMFRAPWLDDKGKLGQPRLPDRDERCDRAVQGRSAVPPLGEPGHPQVPGFEEIFKNSLTTLPMGGGKGGCDSIPRARVLRSHALLPELHDRAAGYIGPDIDVPAGDIGVGGREIGFLFGIQAAAQRVHGRMTARVWMGGSLFSRSHRLRLRLLRAGNAEDQKRQRCKARFAGFGQRQRGPIHG